MYPDNRWPQLQVTRVDRRSRRDAFIVNGEIDLSSADSLFDAVLPAVLSADSDTVLVTMAGVTFFDSSGLDVLLDLVEIAGTWGKALLILEPSNPVTRLVELSGRDYRLRHAVCEGRRRTYLQL